MHGILKLPLRYGARNCLAFIKTESEAVHAPTDHSAEAFYRALRTAFNQTWQSAPDATRSEALRAWLHLPVKT
jgi:hypothetical protein